MTKIASRGGPALKQPDIVQHLGLVISRQYSYAVMYHVLPADHKPQVMDNFRLF